MADTAVFEDFPRGTFLESKKAAILAYGYLHIAWSDNREPVGAAIQSTRKMLAQVLSDEERAAGIVAARQASGSSTQRDTRKDGSGTARKAPSTQGESDNRSPSFGQDISLRGPARPSAQTEGGSVEPDAERGSPSLGSVKSGGEADG